MCVSSQSSMPAQVFQRSIKAASGGPRQGFVAIKVTALANPKLLERTAAFLQAVRQLFDKFDDQRTGFITPTSVSAVYD